MPRVHERTARKNYPDHGIKKGEKYFYWKIKLQRGGLERRSKTYPRPSQLTVSEFWGALYSAQECFEDELKAAGCFEDLRTAVETFKSELETIRDEQQGKLDNMPDGLQQGDTGQLLQERYDGLDSMISDLESVDIPDDPDEDEDEETDEGDNANLFQGEMARLMEELSGVEYSGS